MMAACGHQEAMEGEGEGEGGGGGVGRGRGRGGRETNHLIFFVCIK